MFSVAGNSPMFNIALNYTVAENSNITFELGKIMHQTDNTVITTIQTDRNAPFLSINEDTYGNYSLLINTEQAYAGNYTISFIFAE